MIMGYGLASRRAVVLEHVEADSAECCDHAGRESLRFDKQVAHHSFIEIEYGFDVTIRHQKNSPPLILGSIHENSDLPTSRHEHTWFRTGQVLAKSAVAV